MNAVCGILDRRGGEAEGLDAMLAALAGYGGASARWEGDAAGLGCRGPGGAGSAPPSLRFDAEAGVTVAADARLDDRGALCDALGVPRPERAGLADADLVLRAWLRWGRDCPKRLLGDYAFAVWDTRGRRLFCARDPVGVRPFYYAVTARGFVFASAVEAVLAAPGVPGALDEAMVAAHLTRPLVYGTAHTFFEAVRKLPPGHALTVEAEALAHGGALRPERYWRPEDAPLARPAPDGAFAEEFLALYARAVEDRLRGPDPVGVHLSGGLDTSGVAALAARALRRQDRPPPLALSWLPDPGAAPPAPAHAREYALVEAVCVRERLRVLHRSPGPADLLAWLRSDCAFPGARVDLNEGVVQRCAAQRGVRVILSGWGGDEGASFSGRGHYAHLLASGRWAQLWGECRARDGNPLRFLAGVVLPVLFPRLPRQLRRLRDPEQRNRRWLIDPAFARRVRPLPKHPPPKLSAGVRRIQLHLLQSWHLSERMEAWAAGGARHGLEYRYPLLDRRVLEFALGLPPGQFRRGRWSRWLMRRALAGAALPPEVCWNPGKDDPARSEPLRETMEEALVAVGGELAARAAPPSRAGYVDMPRLLERLDGAEIRGRRRLAPIFRALVLLDF